MRIAAGIFLIIAAVIVFFVSLFVYDELLQMVSMYPYLGYLLEPEMALLAGVTETGVMLTGGILAFKGRLWGFCLAASIIGWSILALIFICVRKGEWQS